LIPPKYYLQKLILRRLFPRRLPLWLAKGPLARFWNRVQILVFPNVPGYFSQSGQDYYLHRYLGLNRGKGRFLDIGAHNGVEISNTFFFEKELGWQGLCVEPIPEIFKKLRANRTAECLCAAASDTDGSAEFVILEEGKETGSHLKRDCDEDGKLSGQKTVRVQTVDIGKLLLEKNLINFDFVSIDIEGGELEIFEHILKSGIVVHVVAMELNMDFVQMDYRMNQHGYELSAQVGADRIYVRKKRP
jgi:FkbM family methyltransferase